MVNKGLNFFVCTWFYCRYPLVEEWLNYHTDTVALRLHVTCSLLVQLFVSGRCLIQREGLSKYKPLTNMAMEGN